MKFNLKNLMLLVIVCAFAFRSISLYRQGLAIQNREAQLNEDAVVLYYEVEDYLPVRDDLSEKISKLSGDTVVIPTAPESALEAIHGIIQRFE